MTVPRALSEVERLRARLGAARGLATRIVDDAHAYGTGAVAHVAWAQRIVDGGSCCDDDCAGTVCPCGHVCSGAM